MWALALIRLSLVALALFLTPHAIAAAIRPRRGIEALLPLSGPIAIALNSALLLAFRISGTAITATSLAAAHLALAAAALGFAAWRHGGALRELRASLRWEHRDLAVVAAIFAVLVFPFTNLAGIDTYKWQDLATSVRMDATLPWVIHPLSVFGFSPRAYPLAQPCLLATAQILGGLSVDAGYYAVSLLCGLVGIGASHALASRLLPEHHSARSLLVVAYVFSPVFLRYAHWATGRGFCLALLPLFIALLLDAPRLRSLAGACAVGVLLATTHKAGAVAALALPPLHLLGRWGSTRSRTVASACVGIALLAAVVFAPRWILPGPAGQALGAARFALTRFGVLLPAAVAGCIFASSASSPPNLRRLLLPFLLLLPAAFHAEMYPAMVVLPYVCLFAAVAVSALPAETRFAVPAHRAWLCGIALFALATIGQRSATAAPSAARVAAQLLDACDPRGPYTVTAEHRRHIQAYAAGFARFSMTASPGVSVARFPALQGPPSRRFAQTISWLRNVFQTSDVDVEWYGHSPRRYYVVVGGKGHCPPDAVRVASRGDVAIYRDASSPPPEEEPAVSEPCKP